jgi:SAM-dependent methyltransferase
MKPWLSMPIDAMKDEPTPHCDAWQCASCGLAGIYPRPSASEVPGFYDLPAYYTHGQGHISAVQPNLADRLLVKLAWWADRSRPFDPAEEACVGDRVVDLGCGNGDLLVQFKALGCDCVGVEPDAVARSKATERGLKVVNGTAEALPPELEPGSFDLVIMSHSLEHCLDPLLALRNAFELTKPGGKLYVEVPNCACVHFEALDVCGANFDSPRHLSFFTPQGLERTAKKAGFTPTSWRFHGFTRHHLRDWRDWENTIADRLQKAEPQRQVSRHSFAKSLRILARSAFATFDRKYDAIGLIAVRPK